MIRGMKTLVTCIAERGGKLLLPTLLLLATSGLADPAIIADIKADIRFRTYTSDDPIPEQERKAKSEEIKPRIERIRRIVDAEVAKLADSEVSPLVRELLTDSDALGFCLSAIHKLFRDSTEDAQITMLHKLFNATPDSLRGFIRSFVTTLPKKAFATAEIQKWLVDKINNGLPAGAYYFILTDESADAVSGRAIADMKRFSKARGNAFHMLSIAFLASRGNDDAVARLDSLIDKRDLENNFDTSYVFPAVAMSGNRKLIQKICGIITTDTRTRWHGEDAIPNETSFSHLAASACALVIEGFPSVTYWGPKYDEKKRKEVQDWLAKNPAYKIKPIDPETFFRETGFHCILPEMYRQNETYVVSESVEAKVTRHLIALNTPDADKRAQAEKVIRDTMADSQDYQISLRYQGAQLLLQEPDAPLEVKRFIADILAEGIVADPLPGWEDPSIKNLKNSSAPKDFLEQIIADVPMRYKRASIEYLESVLAVTGHEILSDAAIANIQKGFDNPALLGREMIFLAYRARLESAPERIAAISKEPLVVKSRFQRAVWAALMVRAWGGDEQAIQTIFEHARKKSVSERAKYYFREIGTIHHPACVDFLVAALHSDERMGEGNYEFGTNPYLAAHHAACALYRMLDGFPEPEAYGFQDLTRSREWVKQQTPFTFRKKPLTTSEQAMLLPDHHSPF